MEPRQPLRPNNRPISTLMSEFKHNEAHIKYPKNGERQSIFSWAGASYRQNGEGFGGGYRISGKG